MSVFDPAIVEVTEEILLQWWDKKNKKAWQWLPDNVRVGVWTHDKERAYYIAFYTGVDDCDFMMFSDKSQRDAVGHALKGVLL